ncbi:MAG TPA: S1/P1 nuclease [Candidatus Angelobacter sp.]|nr:S1/P1 nuclease [Candidatus Angelobacter sp.]
MKKLIALLLLFAMVSTQLVAWGPKGHAIVADIAQSRLTPLARKNLQLLLGQDSLASIASWADQVRKEHDESYDWHFVDIPKDAAGFSDQRDCFRPQDNHKDAQTDHHNCAVDRIEIFSKVLADEKASRADRLEALKWVVHFVGDLHQPLHAIDEARGGNDIKLPVFGSSKCGDYDCNLHWAWDSLLLEHTGYSEEEYVQHLNKLIDEQHLSQQAQGTPEDWANESHSEARQIIEQKPAAIDEHYYQSNIDLVNRKLALAGLRLAAVLNDTLGKTSTARFKSSMEKNSRGM